MRPPFWLRRPLARWYGTQNTGNENAPPVSLNFSAGQFRRGALNRIFQQIAHIVPPNPVWLAPDPVSLTLTTFAPTVATPQAVSPAAASLVLTGFAPSVATPVGVTPARVALTLTTFAPTAHVGAPVAISPTTATFTLTGYPPDVQGDLHTGGFGHVVSDTGRRAHFAIFQGTEPLEPVSITPPTARLALVGLAPAISSRSAVAFTLEELAGLDLTAEELAAILAA